MQGIWELKSDEITCQSLALNFLIARGLGQIASVPFPWNRKQFWGPTKSVHGLTDAPDIWATVGDDFPPKSDTDINLKVLSRLENNSPSS